MVTMGTSENSNGIQPRRVYITVNDVKTVPNSALLLALLTVPSSYIGCIA